MQHLLLRRKEVAFFEIEPVESIAEKVVKYGNDILGSESMQSERDFMQHGATNCFTHSVCVAYMSLKIADYFHISIDTPSMVRGSLLHDFFLYDWHDKEKAPKFHTLYHPIVALKNAEKVFDLNPIEKDIIRKHMFPLCFPLPKYRESWIITLADKVCAASEIWHLYSLEQVILMLENKINTLLHI